MENCGRVFAALVSNVYRANALSAWEALGYDSGAKTGSVVFVDPGGGNYSLAPGSAALAAGIANLPLTQMGLAGYESSNAYALNVGGMA